MFHVLITHRKTVSVLLGLAGAIFVLFMGALSTVQQGQRHLQAMAERYLDEVAYRGSDLTRALRDLEASPHQQCGLPMLLEMRRTMVTHPFVEDVFFIPEGSRRPLCSANLGLEHDFAVLPAPDLVATTSPPRDLWRDFPQDLFSGARRATIVRQGRFAVVSTNDHGMSRPEGMDWETYIPSPEGGYGVRATGTEGLFQQYRAPDLAFLERFTYHNRCSDQVEACVVVHQAWPRFIGQQGVWPYIFLVRAVVFGLLLYFLCTLVLSRHGKPEGRITRALKSGRGFTCLYQPMVRLEDGAIVGCEVLARYEDPFGPMMPDEFVPIVAELGETWRFTQIVFDTALSDLQPILARHPEFGVGINFFPSDLAAEHLPRLASSDGFKRARENGVQLTIEVMETGFASLESLQPTIAFLHDRGYHVAIDDFGTGSSNLQQVTGLAADYLKIDKSFVKGLRASNASIRSSLVPQIVDIARKAGIDLVAEGIETEEQLKVLKRLGIDLGQGYYFARPLSVADLEAFMETRSGDPDHARAAAATHTSSPQV